MAHMSASGIRQAGSALVRGRAGLQHQPSPCCLLPRAVSPRSAGTKRGLAPISAFRDHERSGLPLNDGLPLSLFHPYERLPPEGSTLMREEEMCKPEEMVCKTPTHTYEAVCGACSGTGWARGATGGRRGGRGGLSTCIACHGLGYVRCTTSRFVPDSPAHLSIARNTQPPKQRRPLFDRRGRQAQQQPAAGSQKPAVGQPKLAAEGAGAAPPQGPAAAQQAPPQQQQQASAQQRQAPSASPPPPPQMPQKPRLQAQAS